MISPSILTWLADRATERFNESLAKPKAHNSFHRTIFFLNFVAYAGLGLATPSSNLSSPYRVTIADPRSNQLISICEICGSIPEQLLEPDIAGHLPHQRALHTGFSLTEGRISL